MSDTTKQEKPSVPIGQVLVEAGCINGDMLEMALAEQHRTRGLLGDVLIGLGLATEEIIAEAVGRQTGIAFVRVPREPIAPNLVKLVPEEIARRHRLVPLGIDGSILRLAMANPLDVVAQRAIRSTTGLEPAASIATWSEIAAAIGKSYSTIESFDEMIEELIASAEARVGSDEKDAVARGPVVELVNQLIVHAVEERATDIHLEPWEMVVRVRFRIDSALQPGPLLPKKLQAAVIARVKTMAGLDISETRSPQEGRIRFDLERRGTDYVSTMKADLCVSTMPCTFGEGVVLRVLLDHTYAVLPVGGLGLSDGCRERFERIIHRPRGLILVAGPAGSGKTMTLYAALAALNTVNVKIVTVEGVVEHCLSQVCQTQVDAKAGMTFASGLRAALRCDPDILMVGELRDAETARAALRAAMTGHLVFAALHAKSAGAAVAHLLDMGVEPPLLADTLVGVVSQRLARVVCPACHKNVTAPEGRREELGRAAEQERVEWDGTVAEPVGCLDCRFRGFRGRQPLTEVLETDARIGRLIAEKPDADTIQARARNAGMRTMYEDGLSRVLTHRLTLEELDRVVDKNET